MKILIVDDHAATVTFMRLAFTSIGHTVFSASNVATATEVALVEQPEVVLSDLTFGGEADDQAGGCELAEALRSLRPTLDVGMLAVTGVNATSQLDAALESGFDGIVLKPVDLPSLIAQVDELGSAIVARRAGQYQVDRA